MNHPASFELVTMFDPFRGMKGAATTISDAARYRKYGTFVGSPRKAVSFIWEAACEAYEGRGQGMRAAKRGAVLETMRESEQDLAFGCCGVSADAVAEFYSESRTFKK